MAYSYPVFLSLEGASCLVAGLGAVGARKLASVLRGGIAHALALDLRSVDCLGSEAQTLLADERVEFARRPWLESDVPGKMLVFACTGDKGENYRLAAFCREHKILCNSATEPDEGNFIVPAVAAGDGINVALSTGGQSPLLARRWRQELETWLAPKMGMAALFGRLRRPVMALGLPQERNKAMFAAMADPGLEAMLANGQWEAAEQWLLDHAPEALHQEIKQIFMEFAHVFS